MDLKTPANRALAVLDTPAPAEPIAQRRISKKVRSGIEFMVSGDCKIIKDAAEEAGLSREDFTRELAKPHIAAYMREKVLKQLDSDIEMVRASTFVLGLADRSPRVAAAVAPAD